MDRPIKILYIDDSAFDRALVRDALERDHQGFRLWEATSQETFHQLFESEVFDVILSDFNILGFEGLEVIDVVKRRSPEVPVILVTGTGSEETAVDAIRRGADDYVIKTPSHIQHLPHTILGVLDRYKLKKDNEVAFRALHRANAYLDRIFQRSALPMVVLSMDGIISEYNHAFESLAGYSAEELKGRPFGELVKGFAIPSGEMADGSLGELTLECKDQSARNVEWSASLVPGRTEGSSLILQGYDVTERRSAERKQAELQEQFLQAQKLESVGRLAGGVAHDFNNHLTVINGYCDLLLQDLRPQDPLCSSIAQIRQAGERAAGLTQQLLIFSRKEVTQPRSVNINNAVTEFVKMARRLIGEDIHLEISLEPAPCTIWADPGHLSQILFNLAVNARDAMPSGGTLAIATLNSVLDEKSASNHFDARPGRYVVLTVTDSGTGMDEATRLRIFEPFFTTKPAGKGTGLGLSTVFGIVKQCGGFITVDSEPGCGAKFSVFLPKLEAGSKEGDGVRPATAIPGGAETILVVEDDPAVRQLTGYVLKTFGYHVVVATNGDEALETWRHVGAVHLVITDVVMPGMAGPDLVESLRQLQPGIKVLFVSGYTDNRIDREGVLAPGCHYLPKPFSPGQLATKVREVLDKPE